MRPLIDPAKEPVTLVMNGVADDRNYKSKGVEQYNEEKANFVEAIFNKTYSCKLDVADAVGKFGTAAGFIGVGTPKVRKGSCSWSDIVKYICCM